MKSHPIANVFPMMIPDALDALANDIKEHGLREPIVCHQQMILDGRNRWKACERAGVKPHFFDFKGDDPLAFVVSRNVHRRNMSVPQRAMAAARLATLPDGQRKDRQGAQICAPSQDEAAELFKVSRRTVQHARVVLESGVPALSAAVDAGKTTVSKAASVAKKDADEQRAWLANPKKKEKAWAAAAEQARASDEPPPDGAATPIPADLAEAIATMVRHAQSKAHYVLADQESVQWLKAFAFDLQWGADEYRNKIAVALTEEAQRKAKRRGRS